MKLSFKPGIIDQLEAGYLNRRERDGRTAKEADAAAEAAGALIKRGDRSKETLKTIFKWKNGNSRYYKKLEKSFDSNSGELVEQVLNNVAASVDNGDAESAVKQLLRLKGVQIPTASAVLTNIYPSEFTVIDILALRALGIDDAAVAFYLYYNGECGKLATKHCGGKRRKLDRALWEWGKTHRRAP